MAKKDNKPKKREKVDKPISADQLLTVTDISKIGSTEDPCFGKHFDLSTKECKRCGDSEMCSIAFASKMNGVRTMVEHTNSFKDINNDVESVKETIRKMVKNKKSRTDIVNRLVSKYQMDKKSARTLYRQVTESN